MAKPKGSEKTGGRQKGVPNKANKKGKELLLQVIEGQSEHVSKTLDLVRDKNPVEYLKIVNKFYDYVLPKKRDMTTDGEPIPIQINVGPSSKSQP